MAKKKRITEKDIIEVVRSQAQKMLKKDNVTSVGVGYKVTEGVTTDKLSVQFTVGQKIAPERLMAAEIDPLPAYYETDSGDKIPVDILERNYEKHYEIISDPEAESLAEEMSERKKYRSKQDPIMPGISISHIDGSAGTLGAIVYDNDSGEPLVLSNWHVLHTETGNVGDSIVQPGPYDDGNINRNIMGILVRSFLGLAGDCAVSSIQGRQYREEIFSLDVTPRRTAIVNLGDKVVKSGRTTGVTYGIVNRVGVVVKVDYKESVGVQQIGGFEIGPNPDKPPRNGEVSMGGDSGSLWMIDSQGKDGDIAVGLHFAGETDPDPEAEHAVACNIHSVLEKLNVSFVEKDEEVVDDETLWNEVMSRFDSLSARLDILEATIAPQVIICKKQGEIPDELFSAGSGGSGKLAESFSSQPIKGVERDGKYVWKIMTPQDD